MVNFHNHGAFQTFRARIPGQFSLRNRAHNVIERPPDPQNLLSEIEQQGCVDQLLDWVSPKANILTITGAGLSTESGIPDYRGNRGSYHEGHKPMIHDQFIGSAEARKRYWGRGMVGWRDFNERRPNEGHKALAQLESMGLLGVSFTDSEDYHHESNADAYYFGNGVQHMSIITQNVDYLHQRSGSQFVTELHGRTSRLRCWDCGQLRDRADFTQEMESLNQEWLENAIASYGEKSMRPDGDAKLANATYGSLVIPPCQSCGSFVKPDVTFFGDSVPKHRVRRCKAAVTTADGILCVGTSLTVYSAYRFVKLAAAQNIPICILNVGETRAECDGLKVTKIEAPIGTTLSKLVQQIQDDPHSNYSIPELF
mmetsp:Transcript_10828/g.15954  ORF Transcript_10828/g.15954 Transcript_10828/m.15954 type:complete len:369 (+) Transcript_10828:130-1236(+)